MRSAAALLGLAVCLAAGAAQPPETATPAGSGPQWGHAYDVRVRAGGQKEFSAQSARVAIETYTDPTTQTTLSVTDKGALAATRAPRSSGTEARAEWQFAHEFAVRKAGEDEFGPATKRLGVEAIKDTATGKLLYVTEAGSIAYADLPSAAGKDRPDPAPHHALVLSARGAAESTFSSSTKSVTVECYRDAATNSWVYASEAGEVATLPAKADAEKPAAKPTSQPARPLYALTPRVRLHGEGDFAETSPTFGVEVYDDPNTPCRVYVSSAGSVAVLANPAESKDGQAMTHSHGLSLFARPAGAAKGGETPPRVGVEVYKDNNSGAYLFVSETGRIAVVPFTAAK